ncbi:AMP-binding protein, partial [Mycobacterium avium]
MPRHPLVQRIADVLDLDPHGRAIEYGGQWFSWAQLGATARQVAARTTGTEVGMLLRNRPWQVAAFLGVLLGGGTVVVVNPSRGDERTRADLARLRLPLIIGEPDDLAALVTDDTPTMPISRLADPPGPAAPP